MYSQEQVYEFLRSKGHSDETIDTVKANYMNRIIEDVKHDLSKQLDTLGSIDLQLVADTISRITEYYCRVNESMKDEENIVFYSEYVEFIVDSMYLRGFSFDDIVHTLDNSPIDKLKCLYSDIKDGKDIEGYTPILSGDYVKHMVPCNVREHIRNRLEELGYSPQTSKYLTKFHDENSKIQDKMFNLYVTTDAYNNRDKEKENESSFSGEVHAPNTGYAKLNASLLHEDIYDDVDYNNQNVTYAIRTSEGWVDDVTMYDALHNIHPVPSTRKSNKVDDSTEVIIYEYPSVDGGRGADIKINSSIDIHQSFRLISYAPSKYIQELLGSQGNIVKVTENATLSKIIN